MTALTQCGVIDGHNDAAWEARTTRGYTVDDFDQHLTSDTDIPRLRTGRVGAQFWSVWVEDASTVLGCENGGDPERFGASGGSGASGGTATSGAITPDPQVIRDTLEQIDWVSRLIRRYPSEFVAARTASDIVAAQAAGRIACLMGVEGGHQIAGSLAVLRAYARLGVRYLTLTHTRTTAWADSATDEPRHGGLSAFGVKVVHEMNRLGMLIDLSHVARSTMHAALDASSDPVIFSHSSCRALCDHPRNVPDEVLRRLPDNGGVVMVTFVPQFLSAEFDRWLSAGESGPMPPVTVADVANHVEHAAEVAGIDHIGLGGDYDGAPYFPRGMDGVDAYPLLLTELEARGWKAAELAGLASGNILRVLRATDGAFVAADS